MEKLFIGIPHQEVTTIEWAVALRLMEMPCPYLINTVKGFPIHVAREEMVKDAREAGASHLFFLDSDIILPRNALEILASHEYPVVSALYPGKQGVWCCYNRDGNENHIPVQQAKGKIKAVDSVGLGACLIDMRVFDKIDPPYFDWTLASEGRKIRGHTVLREAPGERVRHTGRRQGHSEARLRWSHHRPGQGGDPEGLRLRNGT